jgi:hypothetical protein
MVMDIIVEMTAGAVVIVVENVAAVVAVETAGQVAAVVIADLVVVVAADADESNDEGYRFVDVDLTKIIRNKYQKIILRCYNLKEPSIGKDRKGASVRLQREGIPLLLVRMH